MYLLFLAGLRQDVIFSTADGTLSACVEIFSDFAESKLPFAQGKAKKHKK
jgi:hypothetical protein